MIKKVSFLALLLLVIGVVGSIVTFSSLNNKVNVSEVQPIESGQITSLKIDTVATDVELITIQNEDEARVELVGKTTERLQSKVVVKTDEEALTVEVRSKKNKWFNFDFYMPTLTLKVFIPEKLYDSVQINGVSTDISIQNIAAKSLTIETVSGDIDGEVLRFNRGKLKSVSGDVRLEEIEGEVEVNLESGDVSLFMNDLTKSVKVKTISGDIEVVSSKEPTDVTFDVSTISGDVNLFDKYNNSATIGNGSAVIELEATSGDISVIASN